MADRFPLILNTDTNQIQEIPSGDNLDLTGSGIHNAGIITASSFSGPIVAGAGTSNIVSGILTAVAADIDDFIDVGSNIQLGNAGVITATSFVGTLNGNASGLFGTPSITVTHVNVNAAQPAINFNDSNHNPDWSIINNNGTLGIYDITNTAYRFNVNADGNVSVSKDLDVDGHTNLDNVNVVGVVTVTGAVNASHSTFGNLQTTGITIENTNATINFNDTNNNPDYRVVADSGVFDLNQFNTGGSDINVFKVNTDGHIDIGTNVDFAAGIDVTGNATVSGNLSVGGVLTYEDVTNVDSVGIVTARNGLRVTGGTSNFSGASHFVGIARFNETIVGTARTAIKLTCTDESTDTTTYPLFVAATTGDQFPKTGTNLSFNSANGTLTATTFSGSGASLTNLPAAQLSGTAAAINGSNITNLNGSAIASGTVPVARIGTGTKNSSTFYRGDGTFQVVNTDLVSDTSPQLGGNLDCNNYVVTLNDSTGDTNNRFKIGNGGDLQIFHASNVNYISGEVDGKDLYLRGRRDLYLQCGNNSSGHDTVLYADNNGTTRLYHPASNEVRLQTTTDGVKIGRTMFTGSTTNVEHEAVIIAPSTNGGNAYHDNHVVSIGQLNGNWSEGTSGADTAYGLMFSYATGASATKNLRGGIVYDHKSTEELQIWSSYGAIVFYQDLANNGNRTPVTCDTKCAEFDTNGHFVPGANNGRDLGTTGKRWRNIYVNDLQLSNEAKKDEGGNDVDGTWGDWTLQEGEENIFMLNNRTGKKYKINLTEVE